MTDCDALEGDNPRVAGAGVPQRASCLYAACYCEENVYQLVSRLPRPALASASVVFISNQDRCVRASVVTAGHIRQLSSYAATKLLYLDF